MSNDIFLIESFLDMMVAERAATDNTIISYRHDLLDFLQFCQRHQTTIETASVSHTRHYFASLTKDQKSTSTSARHLSCLKQFYHFLLSEGLAKFDPTVAIEHQRKQRALPHALAQHEIDTLLQTAHNDTSPTGLRLATLLEILYATGLRVTELLSLQLSMIRFSTDGKVVPFVVVEGKGRKERLVPLHPKAIETLQLYLAMRDPKSTNPYIFPKDKARGNKATKNITTNKPGHMTRQRFGQLLKELALQSNINPERISPHVIRHTFASHLLEHGADLRAIQTLLGHASITTTQIYTHIVDQQLRDYVLNYHPLAQKNQKG